MAPNFGKQAGARDRDRSQQTSWQGIEETRPSDPRRYEQPFAVHPVLHQGNLARWG